MTAIKYIDRLRRLDLLIRTRMTGSACELADRFGLCERTVYEYLNDLRELGAPVTWSAEENSYIYNLEGRLRLGFVSEHSPKEEREIIKGPGQDENTV
jgi:predicted DNA-binding transcriptional regulator YafY